MDNIEIGAKNRLFLPCKHKNIEEISFVYANTLFPQISFLKKKILIGGFGIKKCMDCGEIFWPENSEIKKEELENQIVQLIKFTSIDNFVFYNGNQDNLKKELVKDKTLPEEANFILTNPAFKLNDVILPNSTFSEIKEIFSYISYREIIYDIWDFKKVDPIGKGVSMLFYGPSGTGKTRTAEAIAGELNIPFISVSLKDLESRFMGQTPKNISKAFQEAKKNNALLFFDEADTVLGKRLSSVTTGVDNEINMERSTILKELEAFEGICTFATNFQENIDSAFRRRINFHIKFDLPDFLTRSNLLEYYLIATIPLEEERLSLINKIAEITENLSGADIVQALRHGFTKSIIMNTKSPRVSFEDIKRGVEAIQKAKRNIGRDINLSNVKSMFNIKAENDGNLE